MTDKDILKYAIDIYGHAAQTDMMIEEMSELSKALLKYRRAIRSHSSANELVSALDAVIEEIADVGIMLDQMRVIYGDDHSERRKKIDRLAQRLGIGGGKP